MKYIRQISICATLVAGLAGSVHVHAADAAKVIARHSDGTSISNDDLTAELNTLSDADRKLLLALPNAGENLAERLLLRRVLAQQAMRDGLDKDPLVAASIALMRDKVLSLTRLARLDIENTPPEAGLVERAKTIYQTEAIKYSKPDRTRARHILLANDGPETLEKAQKLLAELRAGASFEEYARKYSIDKPTAVRGGDLGFFTSAQVVEPFNDAVNALVKPGDLSEPIKSDFGYHIIRLEERRAEGVPPFEEVKEQIMEGVRMAARQDGRLKQVETLKQGIVYDKAELESFISSQKR